MEVFLIASEDEKIISSYMLYLTDKTDFNTRIFSFEKQEKENGSVLYLFPENKIEYIQELIHYMYKNYSINGISHFQSQSKYVARVRERIINEAIDMFRDDISGEEIEKIVLDKKKKYKYNPTSDAVDDYYLLNDTMFLTSVTGFLTTYLNTSKIGLMLMPVEL